MVSQRDILLIPFPYSELTTTKVRPVIVLSNNEYNEKSPDIVVVPMTTNLQLREYAVFLTNKDLESGKLIKNSKIKVDRIFSISKKLIRMKIGKVKKEVHEKIKEILYELVS